MAKLSDKLKQGDPRRKEIQSFLGGAASYAVDNFDPPEPDELITLGRSVGSSGWFRFSLTKMLTHVLMIGESGSGKSQMLLRMVYEILFNKDKKLGLYIVDGKGDPDFAHAVATMACAAGRPPVPIVRLGWGDGTPSAVFDGLGEGESWDIYNRLVFMYDLQTKEAESDYYRKYKKAILQIVCGVNSQYQYGLDIEPPRSFEELADRIDYDEWLEPTFRGTKAMRIINPYKKSLPEFYAETISLIAPILPIVAPGGFKLSEYPVVIFSINSEARQDDAQVLFRFLGGCIKSSISVNNRTNRGYWVIDEFGKFGADIIASVITQARSRLMGIVVAMQTVASLGQNPQHSEEIKSGTMTHIFMRTNNAGDLTERAGMKKEADISINTRDGEESYTHRWKEVYKVDPTKVSELDDGEAFVVQGGEVTKIRGKMVTDYKASMFEEAMEELSVREDVVHHLRSKPTHTTPSSPLPSNPNPTP